MLGATTSTPGCWVPLPPHLLQPHRRAHAPGQVVGCGRVGLVGEVAQEDGPGGAGANRVDGGYYLAGGGGAR